MWCFHVCKSHGKTGLCNVDIVEKGNDDDVHMETELKKEAWGFNAKIILCGEEVDQDKEENQSMIENFYMKDKMAVVIFRLIKQFWTTRKIASMIL